MMDYASDKFVSSALVDSFFYFQKSGCIIPVDPAGGRCYGDSTKACKSRVLRNTGERLSNTSLICPTVWDTLAKVRLNPDERLRLECTFSKRQRCRMRRRLIRLLVR